MAKLILLFIFLSSLAGAAIIIYRKAPVLATLPKNGRTGLEKIKIFVAAGKKLEKILGLFSDGILLHRFFSLIRRWVIKVESWLDSILSGLRKKAKERKK